VTAVPSADQALVAQAASATGLPQAVVAAQINEESGFQTNPTSPAGAEGMFQFLPSTYTGLGFPAGTEGDPSEEVKAYIAFMKQLLAWSGGDVQKALAAYNAGQGNWQAGLGYANTILSAAGSPDTVTAGATGTGSTATAQTTDFSWTSIDPFPGSIVGKVFSGVSGDFSTIGDVGKAISGLTLAASKFMELFALLFRPEFWLRVGAFIVASLALGGGLYFLKGSLLWLSRARSSSRRFRA
jgi:hypothetical protein